MQELGPEHVSVIQHDSYYFDRSDVPPAERAQINYDHPDSLETSLLIDHLQSLRAGRPVDVPVYDFANHRRTPDTQRVEARTAVIIEGILILVEKALRDLMDIKVFVDTDADLRILRRIRRDIGERARNFDSVVSQYLQTVRPMHLEFVEPSKRYAHIIMPPSGDNAVAVDMLIAKIHSVVSDTRTA